MKEFIHLFTPVTEGLPEFDESTLCILKFTDGYNCDHEIIIYSQRHIPQTRTSFKIDENRFYIPSYHYHNPKVTHYLDLSKLTTKEESMKLYKHGYDQGFNDGNNNANMKE